ncbi:hypothetical protein HDU93_002039, partial [Gonapodya sp. JEL0774]
QYPIPGTQPGGPAAPPTAYPGSPNLGAQQYIGNVSGGTPNGMVVKGPPPPQDPSTGIYYAQQPAGVQAPQGYDYGQAQPQQQPQQQQQQQQYQQQASPPAPAGQPYAPPGTYAPQVNQQLQQQQQYVPQAQVPQQAPVPVVEEKPLIDL